MADLQVNQNWLVEAQSDVKKKWLEVQIQERASRIARFKQDIEDMKKAQIVKIEASIMMLEREKDKLKEELNKIESVTVG